MNHRIKDVMKIRFVVSFILFLTVSTLDGQNLSLGLGINLSSSQVKLINDQTNRLERFSLNRTTPAINLLFEPKTSGNFSFRTGFFLHPIQYKYKIYKADYWEGRVSWETYTENVKTMNLDLPVLFCLNFRRDKMLFRIETGLYYRKAFIDPPLWYDVAFAKNAAGGCFSAGCGSKKWQFGAFGFFSITNNLKDSGLSTFDMGEKGSSFILEFSLTRVFQLKHSDKETDN